MEQARPSRREDFEIAIICALPLEYNAVAHVFDGFFDEDGDPYGRAEGDVNLYTTGHIGKHSVVLILLPHIGKAYAGSAAASIAMSFTRLRLVLLVGICGGVPRVGKNGEDEILLGDVIISSNVVQYDFGRQYPDRFIRKSTAGDSASRPSKYIRSLLIEFETDRGRQRHEQETARYLKELQANTKLIEYGYPGAEADKLFDPNYRHKHYVDPRCNCRTAVCDDALKSFCEQTGCSGTQLVDRARLKMKLQLDRDKAQDPAIHIGSFATGDTVMKSAEDRDRIARAENIIAFEMEAGGIWEDLPCLVVKGVCDYADSHKNKEWQKFAAATAAAGVKALLERLPQTDKSHMQAPCMSEGFASHGMGRGRAQHDGFATRQQDSMLRQQHKSHMFNSMGVRAHNPLDYQLTFQSPVVIIDARGRVFPIHLETIDTLELFTGVLERKFRDLGLNKIRRGEWFLENHHTAQVLDLKKPWNALMRPGLVLDMSMVFRRRSPLSTSTQCPSCKFQNIGNALTEAVCENCNLTYRRIEEIKDLDVSTDDSSSHQARTQGTKTPTGNLESDKKRSSLFPKPRPPPKHPDDEDDISQYSRVQIIDTSFRIQQALEDRALPGVRRLTVQDLEDPESLAIYLATAYGLPEADCLVILQECGPQLQDIKAELKSLVYDESEDVIIEDPEGCIIGTLRTSGMTPEERIQAILSDFNAQRKHESPPRSEGEDDGAASSSKKSGRYGVAAHAYQYDNGIFIRDEDGKDIRLYYYS